VPRRLLSGYERIAPDHAHLEGASPIGDRLADLAEAHDPERLAAKLVARKGAALPFAARIEASAAATLRASARRSASVSSAAAMVFPVGALTTVIPARVAASRSTLSTPTPARPITRSPGTGGDHLRVHLHLAAHDERVVLGRIRPVLLGRQADLLVDIMVAAQDLDSLPRQRLRDQDSHAGVPWAAPG